MRNRLVRKKGQTRWKQENLGNDDNICNTALSLTGGLRMIKPSVTSLAEYRQEQEQIIMEALDAPDYLDELREIEATIQEQLDEIGWIMQPVELNVRPVLRCIKGGAKDIKVNSENRSEAEKSQ